MSIAILYNRDYERLPEGARAAYESVAAVARAVEAALLELGERSFTLAAAEPALAFLDVLRADPPELVFNLCESLRGDARGELLVPGLLELHGITCTGSNLFALALALDKPRSKEILRGRGISTPDFVVAESLAAVARTRLDYPLIVKPAREDGSIGIDREAVVRDRRALEHACARVLERHRQPALIEEYIEGRELNVSLLGSPSRALPIGEIDFSALPASHPRIVTHAAKWDELSLEFRATPPIAAQLPDELRARVERLACAAFEAIGCRDYGRVDLRLAADGTPYVIEVNPNCDLAPDAGFAKAAARAGLSYPDLLAELVALARARAPRT